MALLDQVTQGMQKLGAPEEQAGAALDNTQAAARLATGLTGKAVSGAGPRMSNLQEQVTQNQARIASEQESRGQQLQAEQLTSAGEAQAEEAKLANEEINEERLSKVDQYNQKANALLNDFNREGRQIDFKKDGAKLEQLGITLRLADDKYIDQLKDTGARKRLDDMQNFETAMMEATFKDERKLLDSNFAFRRLMDADDRKFEMYLAQMGLDDMLEVANAQAEEENARGLYTGIGTLGGAAASGVAAAYSMKKPNPADTTAGTPAPTTYKGVGLGVNTNTPDFTPSTDYSKYGG